jgi:hypothetical protein
VIEKRQSLISSNATIRSSSSSRSSVSVCSASPVIHSQSDPSLKDPQPKITQKEHITHSNTTRGFSREKGREKVSDIVIYLKRKDGGHTMNR